MAHLDTPCFEQELTGCDALPATANMSCVGHRAVQHSRHRALLGWQVVIATGCRAQRALLLELQDLPDLTWTIAEQGHDRDTATASNVSTVSTA